MTALLSAAELAELREVAESAMPDTCHVVDVGDQPTGSLNPVTLKYPEYDLDTAPVIYEGICEVDRQPVPQEDQAARLDAADTAVVVKIPVTGTGAAAVRRGHVVKLIDVVHNPALDGRVFTVVGADDKSYSTKRRLTCREGV